MLLYPPGGQGAEGPFCQLQRVLTKGRHLLQILLKALMIAQTFLCFSFTAVIQLFVVGC